MGGGKVITLYFSLYCPGVIVSVQMHTCPVSVLFCNVEDTCKSLEQVHKAPQMIKIVVCLLWQGFQLGKVCHVQTGKYLLDCCTFRVASF